MAQKRRCLQLGFQDNWLITQEQLRRDTPSRHDDISYEDELKLRTAACEYIDKIRNTRRKNGSSGREAPGFMRLQVVLTAKVLLQRFYTQQSFKTHHWEDVALAVLFLAAKVEDRPVKVVVILNKYFLHNDPDHQDFVERSRDEQYLEMKARVLKYERIILQTLSFNVTYSTAQQTAALRKVVRRVAAEKEWKNVENVAKTFLNDSFQTVASLLFAPEKISGAMVYLALRMKGYTASDQAENGGGGGDGGTDAWTTKFGANKDQVTYISQLMLSLYDAKMRKIGKTSPQMVALMKHVEEELAPGGWDETAAEPAAAGSSGSGSARGSGSGSGSQSTQQGVQAQAPSTSGSGRPREETESTDGSDGVVNGGVAKRTKLESSQPES